MGFILLIVAEFIGTKKVYTFSPIRDHIVPKSVKCTHSITKHKSLQLLDHRFLQPLSPNRGLGPKGLGYRVERLGFVGASGILVGYFRV